MFRIKTLNKISPAGLSVLDKSRFTVSDDVENEDGILVLSLIHIFLLTYRMAFQSSLRFILTRYLGRYKVVRLQVV